MSSLRRGDRGGAVTEIRAALAALGLIDNPDEDLTTGRHVAAGLFRRSNSTTPSARSSSTAACSSTASSARRHIAR